MRPTTDVTYIDLSLKICQSHLFPGTINSNMSNINLEYLLRYSIYYMHDVAVDKSYISMFNIV